MTPHRWEEGHRSNDSKRCSLFCSYINEKDIDVLTFKGSLSGHLSHGGWCLLNCMFGGGILWYLMVSYGILWYLIVSYGILWYLMVSYGILKYLMVSWCCNLPKKPFSSGDVQLTHMDFDLNQTNSLALHGILTPPTKQHQTSRPKLGSIRRKQIARGLYLSRMRNDS